MEGIYVSYPGHSLHDLNSLPAWTLSPVFSSYAVSVLCNEQEKRLLSPVQPLKQESELRPSQDVPRWEPAPTSWFHARKGFNVFRCQYRVWHASEKKEEEKERRKVEKKGMKAWRGKEREARPALRHSVDLRLSVARPPHCACSSRMHQSREDGQLRQQEVRWAHQLGHSSEAVRDLQLMHISQRTLVGVCHSWACKDTPASFTVTVGSVHIAHVQGSKLHPGCGREET